MSNNLNITREADGQSSPHVPQNDAAGEIDALFSETVTIGVTNSNAYSVTDDLLDSGVRFIIGVGVSSPTANVTISLPSSSKRGLMFWMNTLTYAATVQKSGGQTDAAPVIAAGETALLDYDGTTVRLASAGTTSNGGSSSSEEDLVTVLLGTIAGNGNLTLSGLSAIQGVTPVDGDVILPTDQTDATENRPWIARAGAWDEYTGFETDDVVTAGTVFVIGNGDHVGKIFRLITSGTVGTDDLSWNTETTSSSRSYVPLRYNSAAELVITTSINNRRIYATRSGAQSFLIPLYADEPHSTRDGNYIVHAGSGIKTITADTGVTLNGVDGGSVTLGTSGDAYWIGRRPSSSSNDWSAIPMKLPGTAGAADIDTDGTLAANSDDVVPSQKAVKTYVDQILGAQDAMVFQGVIDCSANPNYPAADRGDTYRVSVAGKIGGGSGTNVEAGDILICITDGTSSGTQAGVGSNWTIVQTNIDGAVIGPSSVTNENFAMFDGTMGRLIKEFTATQATAKLNAVVGDSGSGGTKGLVPAPASGDAAAGKFLKADGTFAVPPGGHNPQGVHTIFVPAAAMTARTTNGAASGTVETSTNKIMLSSLDFDTSTQEFAQFAIRMPKSWNEGTITAAFTWSHASTSTNFGVVWAIEAIALSDDDAADTAFGTAQQIADTGGTTNDIYITSATPSLTVGGSPAAEDYVVFQVKRVPSDGSDTIAVDARLHGVTIYYTTDADNDA